LIEAATPIGLDTLVHHGAKLPSPAGSTRIPEILPRQGTDFKK